MKQFVFFLASIILCLQAAAQVSITPTGTAPVSSAILDVQSLDKGLLIPRLEQAQRDLIPSPATGLLIYNATSNLFNYYNGTSTPVTLNSQTLNAPPDPPTEGTHEPYLTQIIWKWNTVPGATGYKWNTTDCSRIFCPLHQRIIQIPC